VATFRSITGGEYICVCMSGYIKFQCEKFNLLPRKRLLWCTNIAVSFLLCGTQITSNEYNFHDSDMELLSLSLFL
jgi:hypothetical protein